MPLNDAQIRALKPKATIYRVADGNGLTLEITPAGSKLWRYRFRLAGKASMLALGQYPAIGLKEARRKREEAAALVAQGINPAHQRKAEAGNTFRAIAEEFLSAQSTVWTPRTLGQRRALLEADIYPVIGDRPISAITPADVLALLRDIEQRAPVMAYFAKQVVGAVFRRAICTLRCEYDPTQPLTGALRPRKVEHHPILPAGEIAGFFERLDAYPCLPTTRAAAELLWLTTVRSVELLGARWEEIDLEAGLWTIPAARMKKRRDHMVPLVPRAVEILRTIEPLTRRSGWLFPNRDHQDRPASRGVLWKVWEAVAPGFSPHGVRGTFSTWGHDSGFDSQHIEAQLNHCDRDATRASYNRAQFLDQRREMLEAWAGYLAAKRAGNVIPFRRTA
jgi:integrase